MRTTVAAIHSLGYLGEAMRRRTTTWQMATRVLCVVTLVFIGLAHRAPAVATSSLSASEIAAFTLPDGSWPALCLPGDGKASDDKGQLAGGGCEACRLAAAMLLPQPEDAIGRRLPDVLDILPTVRVAVASFRHFSPNAAPRAPPFPAVV